MDSESYSETDLSGPLLLLNASTALKGTHLIFVFKAVNRKVQGMPHSQTAVSFQHLEEM